jgi:hypothetical protein
VRVTGVPEGATLKWVPTHDGSCLRYLGVESSGSVVTRGSDKAEGLRACVVSLRPDRTTGSVQIQFAAGAWKTETSDGGRALHGGVPVRRDGRKFYFGTARPYQGGTTIAVAHNLVEANLHTRLVAVDFQGKEHPADRYRDAAAHAANVYLDPLGKEHPANDSLETSGGILSMLDTEFDLPPDRIREFRVQSRPFERAEITNIALKPR